MKNYQKSLDEKKEAKYNQKYMDKEICGYHLESFIGKGGMGEVYKVRDANGRTLALKTLLRAEQTERFIREAKTKLEHPNIIKIYDYREENGKHFFTMEYIEGISLKDHLKCSSLSIHQIIKIMIKLGNAINYAHKNGFLHRDLKPSNIMIRKDNEPVVMDFGLVKKIPLGKEEDLTELTKSGEVLGTPTYMSPEQIRGESKHIDEQTDVYGLGTIFYEMLTGVVPFEGTSFHNIFFKIMYEFPTSPSSYRTNMPKYLETICFRALAKNKEERYRSTSEFIEAFFFEQENIINLQNSNKESKERPQNYSINKYLMCSFFAIILVLLLACILFWHKAKQKNRQFELLKNRLEKLTNEVNKKHILKQTLVEQKNKQIELLKNRLGQLENKTNRKYVLKHILVKEYKKFVDNKGYQTKILWEKEAWEWIRKKGIQRPADWKRQLLNSLYPVVNISYYELQAYCNWLKIKKIDARIPYREEVEFFLLTTSCWIQSKKDVINFAKKNIIKVKNKKERYKWIGCVISKQQ